MTTPILEVHRLQKTFMKGEEPVEVLSGVDFTVNSGEFVCVVGPSGSGKTTLLRCIAGLTEPTDGETVLEGVKVTSPLRN